MANFSVRENNFDTFSKNSNADCSNIGNNLLYLVDIIDTTHNVITVFVSCDAFFFSLRDIDTNRLQLRSIIKTFLRSSQYHCQKS